VTLELAQTQPPLPPTHSPSSALAPVLGRTEPRLWTPPLRELTPETSYGYDVIEFARDVLNRPLDPWQEWLAIHAGELLPGGRPRFRKVLVLVARQNGKTELLVILAVYWLFVEAVELILGTSTKLAYAKESWNKVIKLVERTGKLNDLRNTRKWTRTAAGEEECYTLEGCRYKISASNEEGGRSLTIHRLILDELRQHKDYRAWDASVPAGNAVPHFQVWAISNAGTDDSAVLNDLRDAALTYVQTGQGDDQLGIFEWSAPEGASPLDVDALAQANPNLGYRVDLKALLGDAQRAVQKGGDVLAGFRTENMCQHVKALDGAVNATRWRELHVIGDLASSQLRSRIALCLDVSPDRQHATLAAAAVLPDDRARVEVVAAWHGEDATKTLRRELSGWIKKVRPQVVGWLPNGPAAALAADLADRKGVIGWPPPGVSIAEIRSEVAAICMGFAEQVDAGQVIHSDEPLLTAHVTGASKLWTGDVWRFARKGEGHCDAAYAAAGAVHLARTLPAPLGKPGIVLPSSVSLHRALAHDRL